MSPLRKLPLRKRLRATTSDQSGAALLISLLMIMIASALSIAVLGSVVSQLEPTRFAQKNTRTAAAAEAGLDTALGVFRTAQSVDPMDSSKTIGDRRLLPCTAGTAQGLITGQVTGSPGNLQYRVTVRYFAEDPANRTASWLAANAMDCSSTGGPEMTPAFGLVTAAATGTGTGDTSGDRTIQTVYNFQTTNANVLGGLIHNYFDGNAATLDLCFDAGSAAPPQGTPLRVQQCVPESQRQMLSYRADYTIVLSATQGTSPTAGMCLTAEGLGTNRTVVMRTCNGTYAQKWGYTDDGGLAGQLDYNPPISLVTTNYCLYMVSENTPNSTVSASSQQCTNKNRRSNWRPEPRVGAGHAGSVSGPVENLQLQWVNFEEFGRCFDVVYWEVDSSFMMTYPCKSEPTGYVGWNQTLVWAGAAGQGRLYTVSLRPKVQSITFDTAVAAGGTRFCALAPTNVGGRILMRACDTTTTRQSWIVNRDTGTYATSYTVVDSMGRCMGVGPPDPNDSFLASFSTIVAQVCNGSSGQKWNAPASLAPSGLRDTSELND